MINFTYDPERDTFIGVTKIGTYIASPTGRRDVRQTDHPEKNTVFMRLCHDFRPAGA